MQKATKTNQPKKNTWPLLFLVPVQKLIAYIKRTIYYSKPDSVTLDASLTARDGCGCVRGQRKKRGKK